MPLSDRSGGLVCLDGLGASSYLVNTSCGPIVDESALIAALHAGSIAGAALDLYDTKPLPADRPLHAMPNTLLLSHIGYLTSDAYRVFFRDVVENVVDYLNDHTVRELE
jgi:phosphoglycerate dehydrogenase-like enzyme